MTATPDIDQTPQAQDESAQSEMLDLARAIEAIVLTSDKPVKLAAMTTAIKESLDAEIDAAKVEGEIEALNANAGDRPYRIEKVAGGFKAVATADLANVLVAYHGARAASKLSRAAIETLSVIAYRQPLTRAEIEAIRGVACGEVLRSLLDRRLITVAGRAEELGRPMLYGTTKEFQELFGLASISDLPKPDEGATS